MPWEYRGPVNSTKLLISRSAKCSVLHIGKDNPKNNYIMGHTPLQVVEKERDLGVVVSAGDTLCWEEQIRGMIGKQNK